MRRKANNNTNDALRRNSGATPSRGNTVQNEGCKRAYGGCKQSLYSLVHAGQPLEHVHCLDEFSPEHQPRHPSCPILHEEIHHLHGHLQRGAFVNLRLRTDQTHGIKAASRPTGGRYAGREIPDLGSIHPSGTKTIRLNHGIT